MKNKGMKIAIMINLVLLVFLLGLSTLTVFAWFSGQAHQGKTMAYQKNLYIGAASSEVTNYYGKINQTTGEFEYEIINSESGFAENALEPGSYVYLKTEVKNNSETHDTVASLFLQNVQYHESLAPYLFFGKNEPVATRESYNEIAIHNESQNKYTINSLPLLTSFTIEPEGILEVFWYVYIDTSAGLEVANAFINLGNVTLTYNS